MLEKYFSAPKTLRRLRGGISGPYVDAFADDLNCDGYAPASAVRYIRAAAHLGCFVQRRGSVLKDVDLNILDSFSGHLRRCKLPSLQAGQDQLSRPLRSEALLPSPRCARNLQEPTSSGSDLRSSSCGRLLRLVSNASRHQGTDSPALRPRRHRFSPDARRGCRPVECAGRSKLSPGTGQPEWDFDHTSADHLPSCFSAVPQLPWRMSR